MYPGQRFTPLGRTHKYVAYIIVGRYNIMG
jgi:hypothetical protein